MVIRQKQSRVELHFLPPVSPAAERQETARLIHDMLTAKQRELG